jgi:DNA replication protein DnaC
LAFGSAAVEAGHRVRYYSAADLVDTLYRGLADNSVGKVIDGLLRYELIIVDSLASHRWTTPVPSYCFGSPPPPPTNAAPSAVGSHWPFEAWGRFLPEHTTAVSMLDRLLHHCHVVITDGDSYRIKQARSKGGTKINNH